MVLARGIGMRFVLNATARLLAAMLRLAYATAHRADVVADRLVLAHRPSALSAVDQIRVPAFMCRRRLGGWCGIPPYLQSNEGTPGQLGASVSLL